MTTRQRLHHLTAVDDAHATERRIFEQHYPGLNYDAWKDETWRSRMGLWLGFYFNWTDALLTIFLIWGVYLLAVLLMTF